jgi:glutamate formiminotransferase/formiminotetrahydrofolate cyclodeaminase
MTKSELIGLIPQEALEDAAAWYLRLEDFDRQQVLERRMQTAGGIGGEAPEASFLEALASATPTPGGGSAAAHAGALAAALVAMVGRLTQGKKKYAELEDQMAELVRRADGLRASFLRAVELDATTFDDVMAAFRLPRTTEAEKESRKVAVEQATLEAARQPLEVSLLATECLRLVHEAARLGNVNAISDAGTAAALARACLAGAGLNVRTNVHALGSSVPGDEMLKELRQLEADAIAIEAEIKNQIQARGGFDID